jgi:anaerobic selenocysteine-containing dehydrogenase
MVCLCHKSSAGTAFNEEETIKAIQNLDLMVVIDVIPSEITGWADVVLPESVYVESMMILMWNGSESLLLPSDNR